MVDEVESSILCGHFALETFLDIKGAFDNLSVEAGIRGMRNKSLPHWPLAVLQSEIMAIRQTARRLKLDRNRDINFFVDKQVALLALESVESNFYLVTDCMNFLNRLADHNQVESCWVKAHVGHFLNKMADSLAKRGAEVGTCFSPPLNP